MTTIMTTAAYTTTSALGPLVLVLGIAAVGMVMVVVVIVPQRKSIRLCFLFVP